MKLRAVLLMCVIALIIGLVHSVIAQEADEGGDDDDDDDDVEGDDDDDDDSQWGEATLDHKLNVPWEYPADYVARPLVYSRRVAEFGVTYKHFYGVHYWNEDGDLVTGSFKIKKQTFDFFLGLGITDNLSFTMRFPFTYKRTLIKEGNQNYRRYKSNVYGSSMEDSIRNWLDQDYIWKLWEADLPALGDASFEVRYQVFHRLVDNWNTSLALDANWKFPTGNDNMRRNELARNYITSGNTDFYAGVAFKQQMWKFSVMAKGGYLYRLPAATKFSPGDLDLADQAQGYGEAFFQVPGLDPFFGSFAIGSGVTYMTRLFETVIEDKDGRKLEMDDKGSFLTIQPRLMYQHKKFDVLLGMDVPMMGENSFLKYSRSFYMPPYEIESYEATGITYSLGLVKRWQ